MIWNEKCIISRALQRGMLTWAKRKLVIPFAVYTTFPFVNCISCCRIMKCNFDGFENVIRATQSYSVSDVVISF